MTPLRCRYAVVTVPLRRRYRADMARLAWWEEEVNKVLSLCCHNAVGVAALLLDISDIEEVDRVDGVDEVDLLDEMDGVDDGAPARFFVFRVTLVSTT